MAMPSLESPTQEAPEPVELRGLGADQCEKEEIAVLAYQFWLERGSPVGSPDEDWFRAEAEVRSQRSKPEQAATAG